MKWYLILFFLLFLIPLVNAEGDIYKLNKATDFKISCYDGEKDYCDASVSCSMTINYPDGSLLVENAPMGYNPSFYNYAVEDGVLNVSGVYQYSISCQGEYGGIATGTFEVNTLGTTLTGSKVGIYIVIFIVTLIILAIAIICGITIDGSNSKDEMTGYIIATNNLKYIKILSWALAYIMMMLITYFGWMLSYAFLDMDFIGKLFNFAFYTLAILLLPLFIIGVYIVIANAIRDSKIADALSGGQRIKE